MTYALRIGWKAPFWIYPLPACRYRAPGIMEGARGALRSLDRLMFKGHEAEEQARRAGDSFTYARLRANGDEAAAPLTMEGGLVHDAARVMNDHGASIFRLAYSYLHNKEDAEDILQEVLIRYIKKAPPFENKRHERAWLLTVTANLSKNKIKYSRLRDCDELNEELVAEERKDLSFVWEAVKSLPVQYREAIHLFYEEGYGSAEIAAILGQKDATVRSNLKRARDKLKVILVEEYDFTGGED